MISVAVALKTIRERIHSVVRDDSPNQFLSDKDLDIYIGNALDELDHDDPLTVSVDIPGDGTQDYPLPTEFIKGFSDLESVESPTINNPPSFLDQGDDWFLYEDPTKDAKLQQRLRFLESTPSATDVKTALTVSVIAFVSGNTIKYTFSGSPDLSTVTTAMALNVTGAVKALNNGSFFISAVDDGADTISVTNQFISDNTQDETTGATGIAQTIDRIRLMVETPYTLTLKATTLEKNAALAVVALGSSNAFKSLAARFNQSIDSTIEADTVNYAERANQYLFIAEKCTKLYEKLAGIGGDVKAESVISDADIDFLHGEDFLFHPRRRR